MTIPTAQTPPAGTTIADWHTINGRPWGIGAFAVDTAPKGWPCPICGTKARKAVGRHYYPFSVACTSCARRCMEEPS